MTLQLFKWMMALAIMLYLPVLFERVRRIRKTDTRHSAEYIKQRVESIYFDVTHFYNQLGTLRNNDPNPNVNPNLNDDDNLNVNDNFNANNSYLSPPTEWPDFDRLYCSDAWNNAVAAINEAGSKTTDSDFFTRNYWLCFSELGFLYANKVEVIDYTGDQGTVSLVMHNGDLSMPVLLNIVYERDDWFIDNMTYNWNVKPSNDYFDWRQEMQNYA